MGYEEKRLSKREAIAESNLLKTILLTNTKSNDCKIINISKSGFQVLCKRDFQLNKKIISGVFKYGNEGEYDEVVNSFMAEIMWKKAFENKELLVGLKFHPENNEFITKFC